MVLGAFPFIFSLSLSLPFHASPCVLYFFGFVAFPLCVVLLSSLVPFWSKTPFSVYLCTMLTFRWPYYRLIRHAHSTLLAHAQSVLTNAETLAIGHTLSLILAVTSVSSYSFFFILRRLVILGRIFRTFVQFLFCSFSPFPFPSTCTNPYAF